MPTTSTISTVQSGLTASSGLTLDVVSGGGIVSAAILAGGSAIIEVGGFDSSSYISTGGAELVLGSATGDIVAGSQTVSSAAGGSASGLVTNETVVSGGVLYLSIKTTSAFNTVISSGGTLSVNGNISATNTTVFGGGVLDLASAQARAAGSLVFSGAGGELEITGNTSSGAGDLAVISGFAAGDLVEITSATTVGASTSTTMSSSIVSGNTVEVVSGGGGIPMSFTFSGTAIGANLILTSDGNGGEKIIFASASTGNTTVTSTTSNLTVASGATVSVLSGGTLVNGNILSGGSAVVFSGGIDSGSTINSGASESLVGSANADKVAGTQSATSGASLTNDVVLSGGVLVLTGSATATNTVISGGVLSLSSPSATLAGGVTFNGAGTLDITTISNTGAGVTGVISNFYTSDAVDFTYIGSGATLSTTISGGLTTATVTSGGATKTLTFADSVTSSLSLTSDGQGGEQIVYTAPVVSTTTSYTPGDLVLSIYGNGANTGFYTLDQAAPIVLEEITTTGAIVSQQVLPQATTVVNGVTEYAISGEYESASEGLLTLAANGQSLTILGYGVLPSAFNASNDLTVYGTNALGQSTSVPGGQFTAVPRIVADISYNASVDTSTELYSTFNTNNPRSVYTVNGTTFYVSGQGNGADGTEGVFLAADGSTTPTAIYNTKTDTRVVEIQNGQLYVSIDSKLNNGGGLYTLGSAGALPTTATSAVQVPGISASIVLTSGQANGVNNAFVGSAVNLSPEQYFYANSSTLYIADGGVPKDGGIGDGGLQKWSLVGGTWVLDYTLTSGLNMVANTGSTGTSGLIGLTGTVSGGNVILYATNETIAETDQTYLYGITDTLSATTLPTAESFTLLETAAPDTLIRGVSFAPTASSTTPQVSTTISVTTSSGGLTVASGGLVNVVSGGTISGTTLLSGGSASIASGGTDSGTFIGHGASELVLGSAFGDFVDGVQLVSNATAVVTSETIENGGSLDLFLKGGIASAVTVNSGGTLNISGNAFGNDLVISGGLVTLQSPKAVLSGAAVSFVGSGGEIEVTSVTSAGYGDLVTISGFGVGDIIDERVMGSGTTLSTTISGGNTVATFTSMTTSAIVETFTLAGSGYGSGLALTSDGFGGVELTYTPPAPVTIIVSPGMPSSGLGIASGSIISVLSGGVMSAITVSAGGSAVIALGGLDSGSTISSGGFELVSGSAIGDSIYGVQLVSAAAGPAAVINETVFNGGTIDLFLKPDTATNIVVSSGGDLFLSGNVSATNVTLFGGALLELQSPKAVVAGTLVFSGAATEIITAVTSSPDGNLETISGFGAGDIIDDQFVTSGATLTTTISGGNTIETITPAALNSSTQSSLSFTFAGTTIGANIHLVPDGGTTNGVELAYVACFREGTNIATPTGEVPVERLLAGELVLTAAGGAKPVKWIGTRTLSCAKHPKPSRVQPVRIAAGAFADEIPSRELYLSPDHAVLTDGVLIPIGELINGTTVCQIDVDTVTYYHVELDLHDVILAEGLPAESFLDSGNRGGFANGGVPLELHPEFAATVWDTACAELIVHGPRLAAVRARLLDRAPSFHNRRLTPTGAHPTALPPRSAAESFLLLFFKKEALSSTSVSLFEFHGRAHPLRPPAP